MTKKILIIISAIILLIAGIFIVLRQEKGVVIEEPALETEVLREIAQDWILNNSPTYTYDGFDLQFVDQEEQIENIRYKFTFSFTSTSAGFGDRSDQITAQVITPHIIEVVVENQKVVEAVTDSEYDELRDNLISDLQNDKIQPETLSISVYFVHVIEGQEKLAQVKREIPYTLDTGRAAIEELLKGPLADEKEEGIITLINEGTKLQSIEITDGYARVDFSRHLNENVAGSAMVTAIRGQIENTLTQFETVNEVVISVDSRTEDILQP